MLRKILNRGIHFIKFGFSFFRSGEPYVSDKIILMIDGDPDFCVLQADTLGKQGFRVLLAHTLESAAFQMNAHNPSIILLDHELPDGSGFSFLEKNESALEYKSVILMTADPSAVSGVTTMIPGVINILQKPFPPDSLNMMVYLAAHFSRQV